MNAHARSTSLRELATRTSVHVGSAMVVMGGWAVFANRSHGATAALTAGLVQAAASATITCSLKVSLEALSNRLRGVAAFLLPPMLVCGLVLALLVTAHRVTNTRELWATIAVPYAASFTYAWVYAALLARRRSDRARRTATTDAPRSR